MLRKTVANILNEAKRKSYTTRLLSTATKGAENFASAQLPEFTEKEREKILDLINNKSLDELVNYDISKLRAAKLLAWRNRNGNLSDPDDILMVEGFGIKTARKFLESLLKGPRNKTGAKKSTSPRTSSFIIPTTEVSLLQSIRSCVSLRVGVSSVTWARLKIPEEHEKSPCLLTHWQHYEMLDKKLHLVDLVHRCLYVDELVPTADCYLFENPQMVVPSTNPGSVDQQNVNIQKAQVNAVLSFALCARNKDALFRNKEKVYHSNTFFLRRFLAARLFNNLVGGERVSSEEVILKLMRVYYNLEDREDTQAEDDVEDIALLQIRKNVHFPPELRKTFSEAEGYHREYLGQALLLNLAFVRLMLLQDPASIAHVTRHGVKNDEENIVD